MAALIDTPHVDPAPSRPLLSSGAEVRGPRRHPALLTAQTRCVAGAHGIPVAIPEQVSTADDGVVGLRLLVPRGWRGCSARTAGGSAVCILRGLSCGRGWATPCDAVSCAVLVVTDRAGGGVEGVVGRWQTVNAVGAPGWLLVTKGAFSDRSSWERSYEDLSIVERAG